MPEREIERKMRKEQGLLSLTEAAERLGISMSGLYRRMYAGELESVHVGSRRLVSERALKAYIARSGKPKAEGEA